MDWNSFFVPGSNQNYGFVPGSFPHGGGNGAIFQNEERNWPYYASYNPNYVSEPSNLQPIVTPLVPSFPYGGFSGNSADVQENHLSSGIISSFQIPNDRGTRTNEAFTSPEDAHTSILSASSLTPTAGEFVPRSKLLQKNEHDGVAPGHTFLQRIPHSGMNAGKSVLEPNVKEFFNNVTKNGDFQSQERKKIEQAKCIDRIDKSKSKNGTVEAEKGSFKVSLGSDCNSEDQPDPANAESSFESIDRTDQLKLSIGVEPKNAKFYKNKMLGRHEIIPRQRSGRILQNRMKDDNTGVDFQNSKIIDRQRVLTEAASFYSFDSDKGEVSNSNETTRKAFDQSAHKYRHEKYESKSYNHVENESCQEYLFPKKESCLDNFGNRQISCKDEQCEKEDVNYLKDRSEYKKNENLEKNNKEKEVKKTCGNQNIEVDWDRKGDQNNWDDRNDKFGRVERGSRHEKERYDRGYKGGRSDAYERGHRRDGRERAERSDKNDEIGKRNRSNKGDRSSRYDKDGRNSWDVQTECNDRGNRRWDQNERHDRNERGRDCGDWGSRGSRNEREARNNQRSGVHSQDVESRDHRGSGQSQKTFYSSRFDPGNRGSSPRKRDTLAESGDSFSQNRSVRSASTFYSNEQCSDRDRNYFSRYDRNSNRKYVSNTPNEYISNTKDYARGDREALSKFPANSREVEDKKSASLIKNSKFQSNKEVRLKNIATISPHAVADDDASQRERLSEQLTRGALECLVCCERVRQYDAIWSCSNCYHVLHLRCIKKWARSSKADSGWRCPACQNVSSKMPQDYRCFCGKMLEPEWNRQDIPHSCGEVCGRNRAPRSAELGNCVHKCTLLCHPGPCPPCLAQVSRECGCGRTSQIVSCGSSQLLLCEAICDKILNCKTHHCTKTCHWDACGNCEKDVKQDCFCGKNSRVVSCTEDTANVKHYSCGEVCSRKLVCLNHSCTLLCHEGDCEQCELIPSLVTHCPCGKTPLTEDCKRVSCLDAVPTCDQPCGKQLVCGQPGDFHRCQAKCHIGPCPSCPLTTFVKCRCGHMDREIECKDLTTKADDARCEKRCSKKRTCGKHKCNQTCCIDIDHQCPLPCNHMLSCGQHRCEELCHRGNCRQCWHTSFEELYCECGANVILPPVPCGTRRPLCNQPCSRQHSCDHEALHQCHSEPSCPPCAVLTEKYCYGKHELRKAIPCYQKEFSCGMPCGLPLPCGRHTCILPCHKGLCIREGQPVCTQPCKITRTLCGHPCAAPCHEGPCPEHPCKEMVRVSCECGHRYVMQVCCDQTKEYRRVLTARLASKMQEVQLGRVVEIDDLGGPPSERLKTLECNDECKIIERNRRLNIALQIRNPDLSGKLQPRYSDFLKQWAKKDPHFVTMVHDKLTELVQLAKQSKQKSRSYSFSSMNRDKRHFIHEYCEHFGCESQAYDPEPNRNVVATAQRDKAWLPSMSLLEVMQRESGQRKAPRPVTARAVDSIMKEIPGLNSTSQVTTFEAGKNDKEKEKDKEVEIDYFDFTS